MKYYVTKEKILLWQLSPDLCGIFKKHATNQSRDVHTHVGKSSRICVCCQTDLSSLDVAREHFKSPYHKKNLKKYLMKKSQISNDNINNESSEINDDAVNICSIKQYKHAKVYLDTGQDQLIVFNKFLLKNLLDTESNITKLCWAILMLSGGHFAGAIFEGPTLILHKTFHSYTVRSSKGKQQTSHDKKCVNKLRSAGSSLRRYNEQSFTRHVQKTLSLWNNQLSVCDFIFYKTTSLSKNILFGSKHPVLSSKDDRIFPITITTKKPTLAEVERVHQYLASVEVFRNEIKDNESNVHAEQIYAIDDCFCEIIDLNLQKQNVIRESELHPNILSIEGLAITEKKTHTNEKLNNLQFEFLSEKKNCKTQLDIKMFKVDKFSHTACNHKLFCLKDLFNQMCMACCNVDIEALVNILNKIPCMGSCCDTNGVIQPCLKIKLVNTKFGSMADTLLHLAVTKNIEIIKTLLNFGANPNVRNKSGLTPLMICQKLKISDEIMEYIDTYSSYYKNNVNNSSFTMNSKASKSSSKKLIKLQNNQKTIYKKKENKSEKKECRISSDYHKAASIFSSSVATQKVKQTDHKTIKKKFQQNSCKQEEAAASIFSSSVTTQQVKETDHKTIKKKFQQNSFKQKVLNEVLQKEAELRIKFLSLTETEKQLQSKSEHRKENNRCFQCGIKFGHNIPFIYNDNQLCNISCVKKYRKI